jgi:spore maturation protein CgeB
MNSDLSEKIGPQDLLVFMSQGLKKFVIDKHVPEDQGVVMPIPVDERMFYPLDGECSDDDKFSVDVGFVKHCDNHGENGFDHFVKLYLNEIDNLMLRSTLLDIFRGLYQMTCSKPGVRYYLDIMQNYVGEQFEKRTNTPRNFEIEKLTTCFYVSVFTNTWRYQFIDALAASGLNVGLYGNGWNSHPKFNRFAKGKVDREKELNKVYNFNRINLNIHHAMTMHQRVIECALAGGFMMVYSHPMENDEAPVQNYLEPDKEIVLFDSALDMIDKCRYYLAHPEKRREIAENGRKKALANHTMTVGTQQILDLWKDLLRRSLNHG